MTSRRVALVVTLVSALMLAACAKTTTPTASDAPIASVAGSDTESTNLKKVFKQDQTDIHIGTGETFAIRLPANPSTGDTWQMVSDPDDSFVKADGNSFKADSASSAPGAAGQIEFKFKAKKPGRTMVTMASCDRCGSSGTVDPAPGEPAQRLTFTITVG
jgi:predicted secreted protein